MFVALPVSRHISFNLTNRLQTLVNEFLGCRPGPSGMEASRAAADHAESGAPAVLPMLDLITIFSTTM